MFDANLLFHNAQVITQAGDSAAIEIQKTAATGVPVEIAVTQTSGGTFSIQFSVAESDSTTSGWQTLVTFPPITVPTRLTRVVQSRRRYLRLSRPAPDGNNPSCTVTAGIVSGNLPDQV